MLLLHLLTPKWFEQGVGGGNPHQDGAAFPEQRWGSVQPSLCLEQYVEVTSQRASTKDRLTIRILANMLLTPSGASPV